MAGLSPRRAMFPAKPPPGPASEPPQVETRRLRLRALRLTDSARVRRLAGDRAIATNTLLIPHPYEEGMAEKWILAQPERYRKGREVTFAIVPRAGRLLVGVIGLRLTKKHSRGELGYWIGKPYWNRGYATEAAEAVLRYGFQTLGLHRICAFHFGRNPASGRVLQKLGMTYEGTERQHILKWGTFEDLAGYGILRAEFEAREGRYTGARVSSGSGTEAADSVSTFRSSARREKLKKAASNMAASTANSKP